MGITLHPDLNVSARHGLWQRLVLAVGDAWRAQRQARADRQSLHALRGLSCSTLRDVGLCDQLPPGRPTLSALDYQRGLW